MGKGDIEESTLTVVSGEKLEGASRKIADVVAALKSPNATPVANSGL